MGERRNYHQIQTLQPGQKWIEAAGARHFVIMSADGPFKLGFDGERPVTIYGGFKRSPEGGFDEFEIINTHTAANTIEILCTDDDILDGRMFLSGNIDANIVGGNLNVDNLPAIFPDGVQNYDRGAMSKAGASWANWYNPGGTVQTMFTAAENVDGAIIRTLDITDVGGSTYNAKLFVDTAAPSGVGDVSKRALFHSCFGYKDGGMPNQIYVPPGNGAWVAYQLYLFGNASWDLL